MQDYVVRSTVTHAESAARRAADVIIMLFLCAAAVLVLFRFIWAPVVTSDPLVEGVNDGEVLLVDRVSKFFREYRPGDLVRADIGDGMNIYRVAAAGEAEVILRGGCLYVDGGLLDESAYARGWDPAIDSEITVPKGSVLLLPDDRTGVEGLESHILPVGRIYGRLLFRVYPLNRFAIFN